MDDASHLFIVMCDIRKILCDAWLIPANGHGGHLLTPRSGKIRSNRNVFRDTRATLYYPADASLTHSNPVPWLTFVNVTTFSHRFNESQKMDFALEGVRAFIHSALTHLRNSNRPPLQRRTKYLLALPHINTGSGGQRSQTGNVLSQLIPFLYHEATASQCDIALVSITAADFAAAQSIRMQYLKHLRESGDSECGHITSALHKEVVRLSQEALNDNLVLFLGAGVSASAGLPQWAQLLKDIAVDSGMTNDEIDLLQKMNYLDQARILESRLGNADILQNAVAAKLSSNFFSMSHALLASLPVKSIVTTNYDCLYEMAAKLPHGELRNGRSLTVLPYQICKNPDDQWILKIHGCVTNPSDIVLTRTDYLRYSDRRAALAGIAQALLITKHMLFVGFSLNDENFHKIMDAVRLALPKGSHRLGTSFNLHAITMQEELWRSEVKVVPMGGPEGHGSPSISILARRLEISLDHLVALSTTDTPFLLSHRFSGVVSSADQEIAEILRKTIRSIQCVRNFKSAGVYPKLCQFFSSLSEGNSIL
jgi:hypothetical protein